MPVVTANDAVIRIPNGGQHISVVAPVDVAPVVNSLGVTLPAVGSMLTAADPRAKELAGNANNCGSGPNNIGIEGEAYGLGPGTEHGDPGDVITYERGEIQKTYLDILEVKEGYEVTAVVVKGGNGYNLYLPEAMDGASGLGELPWKDLHSPDNDSGKPAAISHWYVCVVKTGAAGEVKPAGEVTTPDEGAPKEEVKAPAEDKAEATAEDKAEATTEKKAEESAVSAAAVKNDDTAATRVLSADLPRTGAASPEVLFVGLGLVAAGAGLLTAGRGRHRRPSAPAA